MMPSNRQGLDTERARVLGPLLHRGFNAMHTEEQRALIRAHDLDLEVGNLIELAVAAKPDAQRTYDTARYQTAAAIEAKVRRRLDHRSTLQRILQQVRAGRLLKKRR